MNTERRYFDHDGPADAQQAQLPEPEWSVTFSLKSGEKIAAAIEKLTETQWVARPQRAIDVDDLASSVTSCPAGVTVTFDFD